MCHIAIDHMKKIIHKSIALKRVKLRNTINARGYRDADSRYSKKSVKYSTSQEECFSRISLSVPFPTKTVIPIIYIARTRDYLNWFTQLGFKDLLEPLLLRY